jgi:hypothetical protein
MQGHDPYRSDSRHAFGGRGLAILRAAAPGALRATATAAGLGEASLTLQAVRGAAPPQIPPAR